MTGQQRSNTGCSTVPGWCKNAAMPVGMVRRYWLCAVLVRVSILE
jgi:hypothetical protein